MGSITVGVDIGSTTAKAVILNQQGQMWTAIIPSGMSPPLAGKEVYQMALAKSQHSMEDVSFIIVTGYGRVSAEFANKTVTEISCHGRGAHFLNPATRTIIDIGGQDSKAISLDENGKVIDFMINDKCASGTGRFLQTTAELVLRVKLEELGILSAKATDIPNISSSCTVFAQTEMVSLLATGVSIENLVAGLHKAISGKVSSMVKRIGIRPTVMMTGGVAKNSGVVEAFRRELNIDVVVPTNLDPQLVGALGAALIAQEMIKTGATNRG
jgi:predicted CoA-substrate-specific enzyme activase